MAKFLVIVVAALVATAAMAVPLQDVEESNEGLIRVTREAKPEPFFGLFGKHKGTNAQSYSGPYGANAGSGVGGPYYGNSGYGGSNYYGGPVNRYPYNGYNGYNGNNGYNGYNNYNNGYNNYDGYNGYNGYDGYNGYGGGYNNYYPSPATKIKSNGFAASFKIPFIGASISNSNYKSRPVGPFGF